MWVGQYFNTWLTPNTWWKRLKADKYYGISKVTKGFQNTLRLEITIVLNYASAIGVLATVDLSLGFNVYE